MIIGYVILGSLFGGLCAVTGLVAGVSWGMALVLYSGCGTAGLLAGAGLHLARATHAAPEDLHGHKLAAFPVSQSRF